MKVCVKCKKEKNDTEYLQDKRRKHPVSVICKTCLNWKLKVRKSRRVKRKLKKIQFKIKKINLNKYFKVCSKCNITKDIEEFYTSRGGRICKECLREQRKKSYIKNGEKEREYQNSRYVKKGRRTKLDFTEAELKTSKDRLKKWQKEYYQNNKERLDKQSQKARKKRLKSNPLFKMRCNLATRTYMAFKSKGWRKGGTEKLIGVSYGIAKAHIEKNFTKGMSWSNYGEWHVDHIIPLSSATTENELIKLCHYSNLQPLWGDDNLSKNNKILPVQVSLRI